MTKPKFEQPRLITHGTVESMTLQLGPHDRADFHIFNGAIQGSDSDDDSTMGSLDMVCDDKKCRKRQNLYRSSYY